MNDSTLFFASNGHGGFGGLDLFKAKLKNGKVVSIENLGEGFNSPHDDFGLVYADSISTEGYFSSDRKGGVGESDIYRFRKSFNPYVIKAIDNSGYTIRDQEGILFTDKDSVPFRTDDLGIHRSKLSDTNKVRITMDVDGYERYSQNFDHSHQSDTLVVVLTPLENHIQINGVILDETNHQSIYGAKVQLEADSVSYIDTTNKEGEFSFILPEKEQYYITFYKEGYFTNHITPTPGQGNIEIKEPLIPISTGMVLEIENIYYEFDQADITFQAEEILDSLATIMELNPTVEIEVSSHADSRGSDVYNEDLSLQRAKSVIDYLKTKEINSSRLSIRYYGESKLSNDCGDGIDCAETSHSLNRRTEFKVIRF
jgi:outer membrane protein OmpA-like peptidoglycan-associated protein